MAQQKDKDQAGQVQDKSRQGQDERDGRKPGQPSTPNAGGGARQRDQDDTDAKQRESDDDDQTDLSQRTGRDEMSKDPQRR